MAELGVRLVSADRPGLSASDPAPDRSLLDWPGDVASLAAARGLTGLAVLGCSQGAPFALACAHAGIVTAAAVVAGSDELAHPAFDAALDPQLRAMVEMARTEPAAAGAAFSTMSAETLLAMVMSSSSDVDRAVYSEPGFAEAYRRALEEGVAQGPSGYATDTCLAMAPGPFDVAEIGVPVDLWYGGRDASPVHSPDFGATLASRIPTARRRFEPDAGGSLLWTHSGEILRSLLFT